LARKLLEELKVTFGNSAGRPRLPLIPASGTVYSEAKMAAARQQIQCAQCDKTEEYCKCDRYCGICKGHHNVRLAIDGLYYCAECREACDVSQANS
jgi:hypothetical protein